jgi:hypothetical protein
MNNQETIQRASYRFLHLPKAVEPTKQNLRTALAHYNFSEGELAKVAKEITRLKKIMGGKK